MITPKWTPGIKAERGNVADRHPLFLTAPGKAGLLPWCDEDAQLFAAAADLYEALLMNRTYTLDDGSACFCERDWNPKVPHHQGFCSQSRAALAKAEGVA